MGQKQKSFPSSPKWDDVVSLYLPKLYSAVGWAASSSGSDESKVKGKNCCNLTFFFFPLAAIKTWEKSKPDDVFQKLHDSLFDCRFASVPIVLKNPLKNSLQSHTAASTNVIYIGLQLYCFICVCSSFGFLTNIIFISQSIIGLIGTLFQFLHRFSLLWLASVTRLRKTIRSGTKEDFIWRVNIQSIV